MSFDIKKKLPLIATIAVIVIVAIAGYYLINLKQGPYPPSSFISLQYKWGEGDTLVNSYNSANGHYQYLDNRDSLIIKKVKLNANNVIFLHGKSTEIGLWELPNVIGKATAAKQDSTLRYELVFNYEKQTKRLVFYPAQIDDVALANTASKLIAIVEQTIKDAEERTGN